MNMLRCAESQFASDFTLHKVNDHCLLIDQPFLFMWKKHAKLFNTLHKHAHGNPTMCEGREAQTVSQGAKLAE